MFFVSFGLAEIFEKTFKCYLMEDAAAEELRQQTNKLEGELQASRNVMKLGYVDPETKEFKSGSSVLLRTTMRTAEKEEVRKACYEGLRAIGKQTEWQCTCCEPLRCSCARTLTLGTPVQVPSWLRALRRS